MAITNRPLEGIVGTGTRGQHIRHQPPVFTLTQCLPPHHFDAISASPYDGIYRDNRDRLSGCAAFRSAHGSLTPHQKGLFPRLAGTQHGDQVGANDVDFRSVV